MEREKDLKTIVVLVLQVILMAVMTAIFKASGNDLGFSLIMGVMIGIGRFKIWIRNYGSSVVVIEPSELRREIIEDNYGSKFRKEVT